MNVWTFYVTTCLNALIAVWNILFMAPRIKMIVNLLTYVGASLLKRCDVSICFYRSWSRIGCL